MATANELLLEACASGIACLGEMDLLRIIAQGASTGGGGSGGGGGTLSTDGTFAANSDLLYPSQKAAKTYVDAGVASAIASSNATADSLYVKKAGDTMTGALIHPAGAVGAPSISTTGDTNTGIYFPAADIVSVSTGGVQRMFVDATGNVGIGGATASALLTIGTNLGVTANLASYRPQGADSGIDNYNLYLNQFVTSAQTGNSFGLKSISAAANAAGSVPTIWAMNFQGDKSGAGTAGQITGMQGFASNSGTGAITLLAGAIINIQTTGASAIATGAALTIAGLTCSAGTITNHYAIKIDSPLMSGGGAITTNYGLFINSQTGAGITTTYALYVAGSQSYFGGNVGLGQASPTAVLHLKAGTATASTAPLKFTAGINLTTLEIGAMEFVDDGTIGHLYVTVNVAGVPTRVQIV